MRTVEAEAFGEDTLRFCLGGVVQRRTRRGLSTMGGAESFGSSEMLIQGDGRISWKRNRALKYRGEVRKCFGELVRLERTWGTSGCGCLVWGGYEAGDKEARAGESVKVKSGKIWACYSLVTMAHGMQQETGQSHFIQTPPGNWTWPE
jgi:hypothetical protein